VEEAYRAQGKSKDDVPVAQLRAECRAFAEHWLDVQREQFIRLGCLGDWARPYTTMAFAAEAQIVREFLKFAMNGALYQGSKPVMWSVVEKTRARRSRGGVRRAHLAHGVREISCKEKAEVHTT